MTERIGWIGLMLALGACGGETGTVEVAVSAEEAAVDGYPVGEIGFVDGWTMQFSTVLFSVDRIELHGADGAHETIDVDPVLVDLHHGRQVLYSLDGVGARRWEDVRYVVSPPTEASVDVGEVDPALRRQMIDNGWSVYLDATAQKGAESRRIAWGLDLDILNSHCVSGDGTDGVVVPAGAVAEGQITFHLDHLFFDTLRLDAAEMRFDAMAAVGGPDGSITFDDLNRQRLADLRDADGSPLLDEEGNPLLYDPGSFSLEEPTLLYMMRAAAITMGHWNGEGHCEYSAH
jgi:hypothetical protein